MYAADRQQVEHVITRLVADLSAGVAGGGVDGRDADAGQHGAARIRHAAEDIGGRDLGLSRAGQEQAHHAKGGTPDERHSLTLLM